MSTIEEFKNAPIGTTATHTDGSRAVKINDGERSWVTPTGVYYGDNELEYWNFTLSPSAPTTAREAIDLTWELAHEVKEGQVIPEGAWMVDRRDNKITVEKNTFFSIDVDEWGAENIRTLEPLRETEPDWLDAPAVLANEPGTGKRGVFIPTDKDTGKHWAVVFSALSYPWQELTDVTPLYPKEVQDA